MKLIYLILFILITSLVNAENADFQFNKQDYSSFETVQVRANFSVDLSKDISLTNVKLYNSENKIIPLGISLNKINNKEYFIYFDLPSLEPGSYNFGFYDVFYNENNQLKKNNFTKTFNLIDNTENILSIRPAFVSGNVKGFEEYPFTLILRNKGINDLNINFETEGEFFYTEQNNFVLNPGVSKNVNVKTNLFNKDGTNFNGKLIVNYNSLFYEIPFNVKRTLILDNKTPTIEEPIKFDDMEIINESFEIADLYGNELNSDIEITVQEDETSIGDFSIVNYANPVYNITLTLGGLQKFATINPVFIEEIPSNGIYPFTLIINQEKNLDNNYTGEILIKSGNGFESSLPLKLILRYKEIKPIVKKNETLPPIITPPQNPENKNTIVLIVLVVVVLIIILLIIYLYKKNKYKEQKFNEFVETVKNRRN